MLPKTTQATQTDVEGNTTVELTGNMGDGTPLVEAQDQEEQTAVPQAEEVKEETQGTETKVSEETELPRPERRMGKLIDTLKDKTNEVSELRQQLESLKVQPVPQGQNTNLPPWFKPEIPQGEIPIEEFQLRVVDSARNIVKAELGEFKRKSLQVSDFEKDLTKVESKYDILNPEKVDVYDKKKAGIVAKRFEEAQKANPKLRLSEYVDELMSFHQAGQEKGQEELKSSVIKRDAQAAVTPNPMTGDLPNESPDWESMPKGKARLQAQEKWMKENGYWE